MLLWQQMLDDRPLYIYIGEQIASRRKAKGMTQARLAELVNLSRVSISNIEKGRQNFLVHKLWEISRALGTHPAELLPKPAAGRERLTRSPASISFNKLPAKDRGFIGAVLRGAVLTQDPETEHATTSEAK